MRRKNTLNKEILPSFCHGRLAEYYPAGVPSFAIGRLNEELAHLDTDEKADAFILYYQLSQTANRTGHIIQVDGSSVGSILTFLLGSNLVNPLPAHYYCVSCGQYELAKSITFGIDLPEKKCPNCGYPMRRDGFSLPTELVWRSKTDYVPPFEYRISKGFYPFAYQTVKEFFTVRGREIMPYGIIEESEESRTLKPVGISVLPIETGKDDFSQFTSFLADGSPCMFENFYEMQHKGIDKIILAVGSIPDAIYRVQSQTGIIAEDVTLESLIGQKVRDITNTGLVSGVDCSNLPMLMSSYYDIACALTFSNNTYANEQQEKIEASEMQDLAVFQQCAVYCREDIFDKLLFSGFDRKTSAEVAEFIGFGKAISYPEKLSELQLPGHIESVAKCCAYLFPRGSGVLRLISLMILAQYLKYDPRIYFKAVFDKCCEV